MELIEIISWVVVSIIFFALALAYLSHTSKLRERELRKLRRPSTEAIARVKACDEELVKTHVTASAPIYNDVETELQKLRRPSPEAVAIVKARDEELARIRNADTKIPKHEPQSYEKGAYWKNQPLSPKRFN